MNVWNMKYEMFRQPQKLHILLDWSRQRKHNSSGWKRIYSKITLEHVNFRRMSMIEFRSIASDHEAQLLSSKIG